MRPSPFLDDPRDLLSHHVTLAMTTPMAQLAAIHIGEAIRQAELARASGLDLPQAPAVAPCVGK